MSKLHFLSPEEDKQLVAAIQLAELNTSGEIRVHFSKKIAKDVYSEATSIFKKLKMDKTERKNGVLIYIVLSQKSFCIIGDSGIHEVVKDVFWNETKDIMQNAFKQGSIVEGLVMGIQKVGEVLKNDFPYLQNDTNELSNEISKDA